jgi:ABC-type lipoprotein release transport system permease subunit
MVIREVLLVAIDLGVGVPATIGAGRSSRRSSTAFRATIRRWPFATAAILLAVSMLAGLIPAHRASRIDSILALRYE